MRSRIGCYDTHRCGELAARSVTERDGVFASNGAGDFVAYLPGATIAVVNASFDQRACSGGYFFSRTLAPSSPLASLIQISSLRLTWAASRMILPEASRVIE